MMTEKQPSPDDRAHDFEAMHGYWEMVDDFLHGADTVISEGRKYLPKFANEGDDDYKDRLNNAKFTNILRDICEDLAAKPFAKELNFADADKVPEEMMKLAEDIDGRGNHMHVFAADVLFWSIPNGLDFILVDKTRVRAGATLAEERAAGARPYWLRIPASCMIAAYTAMIDGREQFVHVRFEEERYERDGQFGEKEIERVRVFNRERVVGADGSVTWSAPTYEVWEERKKEGQQEEEWVLIPEESGVLPIPFIPLVPVLTGKRIGTSWEILPPMRDVVHLQKKHYQNETNLEYTKNLTAAPMLTAKGVNPPMTTRNVTVDGITQSVEEPVKVPVGPKTVLYGPPDQNGTAGEWSFIEINGSSLTFLATEIDRSEKQMRELGRQPLTAQMGNLTVVTTAFAASKGISAVQAWALGLKDALELAWTYTAIWMGRKEEPTIAIHTDFAIDMESDKAPDFLLKLRGMEEISREALISEAKRRDLLGPEYDAAADLEKILSEIPAGDVTQDEMAALGQPNAQVV